MRRRPFLAGYRAACRRRRSGHRALRCRIRRAPGRSIGSGCRPGPRLDPLPARSDQEPDDLGPETPTPVSSVFDTPDFRALSARRWRPSPPTRPMRGPRRPRGRHRDDAALAEPSIVPRTPDTKLASSPQLQEAATKLLELGLAAFPGRPGDDGRPRVPPKPGRWGRRRRRVVRLRQLAAAIAALQAYVDAAPADATARSLLANLIVRSDPGHGLERAAAIGQPLIDDADAEAAGQIIRADSRMYAATATGPEPVRGSIDPARCAGRLRPGDRADR